jgi:hypothetical protein
MSENRSNDYVTNTTTAWREVGEAISRATELYRKELSAYLSWARDFQREILEESLTTTQSLARFGEKRLASWARIRESLPVFGLVPKGTQTVAGMVEAIVQETEPRE